MISLLPLYKARQNLAQFVAYYIWEGEIFFISLHHESKRTNNKRCNQPSINMKTIKVLTILVVELLLGLQLMAQTNTVFKLTKEEGHFYFKASLNGVETDIWLESGVPGLILSEAFYNEHKDSFQMEVKETKGKMRFLKGTYNIKYTAQARLRIGDAIFEGTVMVLEGDHKTMVPINMLRHQDDNSAIVKLNLPDYELSVCSREAMKDLVNKSTALDISFNHWGMPVVTTKLSMDVEQRKLNMEGNFIIDMGNGSLLFLNKNHENVANMLKYGMVNLKPAYDKKGNVVSEGLFANKLTVCGKSYKNVSVGVTSHAKALQACGYLGLKFFVMPVVFDFDNQKMYLCK